MDEKASYKDAGVDIDQANLFIKRILPLIKLTSRKEVMNSIGGFGGLFHLDLKKIKDPVLVASTDGVGTKIKIAQMMNKHDTVGIDLVAMSVNDIVVQGAEPLFFLDYIAIGHMDVERNVQLIEGVVAGCQEAGCSLIGGETAEMPGIYAKDEYDLAGFCIGVVENGKIIDGSDIHVGDLVIGIASNGIHSNGYSLVRNVLFEKAGLNVLDHLEGIENSLGEELLRPTRIYVKPILNLIKNFNVKGIVHITGGGFFDNIPRIVPRQCCTAIKKASWPVPPIFNRIQEIGNIEEDEMFRVFNMGIGMMLVVSEKEAGDIMERLNMLGEKAYIIGSIEKAAPEQSSVSLI
ncbi:phosphoribosylformylglycinamidine cyclo-ligase [Syntrophus gentianae]|uniref:Phosphoribosylformylglycinamidine cyclo-ligase n=1 Tax=Syntrophus gentianae TaxID=43775 RepID=A0A1H7XF57_9BACT|nr:phosphoribosylformylglycinamidine cyclo-ligase [Syntrophus gentianae]SEM32436.1 phosphoribosylformylglycinamidine cyclo-ligase [Syntrophus gentianae]